MTQTIERTALSQLLTNEDYARKVMPHMKGDYLVTGQNVPYLRKSRSS